MPVKLESTAMVNQNLLQSFTQHFQVGFFYKTVLSASESLTLLSPKGSDDTTIENVKFYSLF